MNPVLVAVIERLMDDIGGKIAVDVPMGTLDGIGLVAAPPPVIVDDHETLSAVAAAVAGTGIP